MGEHAKVQTDRASHKNGDSHRNTVSVLCVENGDSDRRCVGVHVGVLSESVPCKRNEEGVGYVRVCGYVFAC
jgi:hypothetical protein